MVKYIAIPRSSQLFKASYDEKHVKDISLDSVQNKSLRIDWAYLIEEDGVLEYKNRDGEVVHKDVRVGDVVLQHYMNEYNLHFCSVVHSDELLENIRYYDKKCGENNDKLIKSCEAA